MDSSAPKRAQIRRFREAISAFSRRWFRGSLFDPPEHHCTDSASYCGAPIGAPWHLRRYKRLFMVRTTVVPWRPLLLALQASVSQRQAPTLLVKRLLKLSDKAGNEKTKKRSRSRERQLKWPIVKRLSRARITERLTGDCVSSHDGIIPHTGETS